MTRLLHLAVAILGLRFARQEPSYRRASFAIALLFAIDAARAGSRLLRGDVSARIAAYLEGRPVPPYEGLARWSWAFDQTLTIAWYTTLATAVWMELKAETPRDRDDSLGARIQLYWRKAVLGITLGAAVSMVLFCIYPAVRGRPVENATTALFLASLAVQVVAIARYFMRWHQPNEARCAAFVIAIGSIADLVLWTQGHPARGWSTGGPTGMLIFVTIGGIEAWGISTRNYWSLR